MKRSKAESEVRLRAAEEAEHPYIRDFVLTDEESAKISAKELGHSEIANHDDTEFLGMLCGKKIL